MTQDRKNSPNKQEDCGFKRRSIVEEKLIKYNDRNFPVTLVNEAFQSL
jgi:hypothetical protein